GRRTAPSRCRGSSPRFVPQRSSEADGGPETALGAKGSSLVHGGFIVKHRPFIRYAEVAGQGYAWRRKSNSRWQRSGRRSRALLGRSEERRVGKECRSGGSMER